MIRYFSFFITLAAIFSLAACGDNGEKQSKIVGERIPVLSYQTGLYVDTTLAEQPINLAPAFLNTAWTQPGGFPTHAAYHLSLYGNSESFKIDMVEGNRSDARIIASPIYAQGRVYAVGAALDLVAVDGETGARLWEQSLLTDELVKNTGWRSWIGFSESKADVKDGFSAGIAYYRGRIYATTGFGELLAINAETGIIEWRVKNFVPFSNAPTIRDGRVFVVSQDSRLQAFEAATGRRLWEHLSITEPADILSATSPAVNQQAVIAGFSSGEIVSLQTVNGSVNWSDSLSASALQVTPLSELNSIVARPVIDRDRVYAISHGGRMAAIDLRSGERIWTADIASIETPWVTSDYVLVMTTDAQLVCMSRALGKIRWVTQLERYVDAEDKEGHIAWTGPILAGQQIITVSNQGAMVFVSPYTGEIVERRELGEPVSLAPIVANGGLYILDDDGQLHAFR